MQLFQRYHYHNFHKLFHTDFWLFEFAIWLHVFGRSLISIFIPIFLLELEHSVNEVMLYYLIFNIFDFPLNFFAKWLTEKIGARKVMILGSLSYIAFFICLYNLTLGNWALLIVMALFMAFYDTFYWVSHLYIFMKCSKHDENVSGDTGLLYIMKRVAGILAPIIGAAILIFFKEHVLILMSIVFLTLSLWPLLKIKNIADKPRRPTRFREFFKGEKRIKEYILMGLYSFHSVSENIIWPVFIYMLFKSVESVAIIPVIISATVVIFTYFTGKIKKKRRAYTMAIGALFIALVWMLRLFIDNIIFYYLSVFLVGFFSILIILPLDSSIFEKGEKKSALAASTYRNAFSMFPRIFFYGFLFILLEVFKVSFISAAISMLVIMMLSFVFAAREVPAGVKEA